MPSPTRLVSAKRTPSRTVSRRPVCRSARNVMNRLPIQATAVDTTAETIFAAMGPSGITVARRTL